MTTFSPATGFWSSEELNTRLKFRIQPFKLTKRQVLIDRLVFDPEVLHAAAPTLISAVTIDGEGAIYHFFEGCAYDICRSLLPLRNEVAVAHGQGVRLPI